MLRCSGGFRRWSSWESRINGGAREKRCNFDRIDASTRQRRAGGTSGAAVIIPISPRPVRHWYLAGVVILVGNVRFEGQSRHPTEVWRLPPLTHIGHRPTKERGARFRSSPSFGKI